MTHKPPFNKLEGTRSSLGGRDFNLQNVIKFLDKYRWKNFLKLGPLVTRALKATISLAKGESRAGLVMVDHLAKRA